MAGTVVFDFWKSLKTGALSGILSKFKFCLSLGECAEKETCSGVDSLLRGGLTGLVTYGELGVYFLQGSARCSAELLDLSLGS